MKLFMINKSNMENSLSEFFHSSFSLNQRPFGSKHYFNLPFKQLLDFSTFPNFNTQINKESGYPLEIISPQCLFQLLLHCTKKALRAVCC